MLITSAMTKLFTLPILSANIPPASTPTNAPAPKNRLTLLIACSIWLSFSI